MCECGGGPRSDRVPGGLTYAIIPISRSGGTMPDGGYYLKHTQFRHGIIAYRYFVHYIYLYVISSAAWEGGVHDVHVPSFFHMLVTQPPLEVKV